MRNIILKRVPRGFDWPLGVLWFGYVYEPIPCELCLGIGSVNWPAQDSPSEAKITQSCPTCNGNGKVIPIIEVPIGNAYQLWETQNYKEDRNEHYYYPTSPVFNDSYNLAEWMAQHYIINGDPLNSEATWHEAIQDNNIDTIFGLYRDNIECK